MSTELAEVLPPDVQARLSLRLPRRQRFVEHYLACGNATLAAERAGYRGRSIRRTAQKLLHVPEVAQAIVASRKAMAERAAYTMDKLIVDLDEAAEFAKTTENATALVRARELKGKALGLLVDRIDARVQAVPFRIEINTALPVFEAKPEGGA